MILSTICMNVLILYDTRLLHIVQTQPEYLLSHGLVLTQWQIRKRLCL